MVYKIADLYIEVNSLYSKVDQLCAEYRVDDPPYIDFTVNITKEDIIKERDYNLDYGNESSYSARMTEFFVVYRKICEKILDFDAFLMHGALIEYENRGYLFTAKSGIGKTTHISLWKKVFGEDKVTIVNGDKPLLRLIDGKIYAYGTPWCGKENYNVNKKTELCAIAFVERAKDNSVVKISDVQALPRILSQIMFTDSPNLGKQLELVDKMLETIPMYLLKCNMEDEAAIVSYEALSHDG